MRRAAPAVLMIAALAAPALAASDNAVDPFANAVPLPTDASPDSKNPVPYHRTMTTAEPPKNSVNAHFFHMDTNNREGDGPRGTPDQPANSP